MVAIPHFSASADETLVLVNAGYTVLTTLIAVNNDGSDEFVQLFNAATTGDVTLGTTTPYLVLPITGSGRSDYEFSDGIVFGNGLVYAVTTESTNAVGPNNPAMLSLGYRG